MSEQEIKRWEASEPDRLEERAQAWEREARLARSDVWWLLDLACHARKTAADLRAMRAARMRLNNGKL